MKYALQLLLLLAFVSKGHSQLKPIGWWRDHLSMQQIIAVDTIEKNLIAAAPNGYFIYDVSKNEFEVYSKSNRLTDVNIRVFSKQPLGSKIIVGYENGNIDIITGNICRNFPDIKLSKIVADKKIYHISWKDQLAYISTNFGIVVMDPYRYEIVDTYFPGKDGRPVEVFQTAIIGNNIYANTMVGIQTAELNRAKLSDFRNWNSFEANSKQSIVQNICKWEESLVAQSRDSISIYNAGSWKLLYVSKNTISNIKSKGSKLFIFESSNGIGSVRYFNTSSSAVQELASTLFTSINDCIPDGAGFWIGDQSNGLIKIQSNTSQQISPNGPSGLAFGQGDFREGILVAVGGDQLSLFNSKKKNECYVMIDDKWKNYRPATYNFLAKMADFGSAVVEPQSGKIYIATKGTGLLSIEKDDKLSAVGITSSGLQSDRDEPGLCNVAALAFDASSNLWMTNPNTNQPVVVKKKDGSWKHFSIPFPIEKNLLNKIMVDAQGRKWMTSLNASGLICFDDNNTIDATNDDQWRLFQQGTGRGNLPSSNVLSIAEDQSGNIWVGTDNGIGIIQCGNDLFRNCDATLPVVQLDNFAGLLLSNETINDIKVDGADRKWIASNNGVWLLSADGQKVIYRFTAENSKLLSNQVSSIIIQAMTGEVFFMTISGISSFRSTATSATETPNKPIVFPNPVPSGYNGTIGIKELPLNAWVKITELDGRLVYQTRSLGGQAIWNGRNYKGERVSSGVYLIIVSNQDNSDQVVGKIFFIK
jgi:ligand-binding sensor domain-containing protein